MATNVRSLCLDALLGVERKTAFADTLIEQLLKKNPLPANDAAFLRELFFGILRNRSRLDFLIDSLAAKHLDIRTRNLLRIGLYQIFQLRVPDHAAVNETVNLGGKARGLINAVLRRALREKDALTEAVDNESPTVRFSHPEFLVERWTKQFDEAGILQLLEWNNQPAPVYFRVNTLRTTRADLIAQFPDAQPLDQHNNVLQLPQIPTHWIEEGLGYVQDPSTLAACDLLAPEPNELVLDACAAPGGKTTYLAQLMGNTGRIIACDSAHDRIPRLCENIERMGIENSEVRHCDWTSRDDLPPALTSMSFDRILVDAPCSNTGVMRRRADVRWRLHEGDFLRMQSVQLRILNRVLPLLKPGGTLVYSTCSLEPEENEEVVAALGRKHPALQRQKVARVTPVKDGFDGAFAASWVKAKTLH